MLPSEEEIRELLANVCRHSVMTDSEWRTTVAHALADKLADGVVWEEKAQVLGIGGPVTPDIHVSDDGNLLAAYLPAGVDTYVGAVVGVSVTKRTGPNIIAQAAGVFYPEGMQLSTNGEYRLVDLVVLDPDSTFGADIEHDHWKPCQERKDGQLVTVTVSKVEPCKV